MKILISLVFIFNVLVTVDCFFNLFKILSHFSLPDILFKSNLFFSSTTLESGIPILPSKNWILLSFCSYSTSISDIVSSIIFIAFLKTLLWIKAFWPDWDLVEIDSLMYLSIVCQKPLCVVGSFLIIFINSVI